MRKNKKLAFVVASIFLATLWGCGSNLDSGGDQPGPGTSAADVTYVGSDTCKVCHTLAHTAIVSPLVGALAPGANALSINHECEACHGSGQFHNGIGPIPNPSPDQAVCNNCHESKVAAVLSSPHVENGVPKCAGCHTSPNKVTAAVVVETCSQCHVDITSNVLASRHARNDEPERACARCHTTEGSIEFAAFTGDKNKITELTTYLKGPDGVSGTADDIVAEGTAPTCGSCHDHSTGMRSVAGWDPNGNATADQFDTCTSCHTYYNQDGVLTAAGDANYKVSTGAGVDGIWFNSDDVTVSATTAPFYHNTSWYRTIASTHYDNPATTVIEGYNVRTKGGNPCFDCHGHELRTNTRYAGATHKMSGTPAAAVALTGEDLEQSEPTIYTEWAQSGHAGGILAAKYAVARTADSPAAGNVLVLASNATQVNAVMGVGATEETGAAWVEEGYAGASDACKRCHTATGAAAYLSGPATYNPATLDFSHLTGSQREVLYCWGCHTNASAGELRTPGQITATYKARTYNTVNSTWNAAALAQFPNVGEQNNICISCHSGRESGESILALADTGMNNVSFKNPHYLGAAGMMYAKLAFIDFISRDTVVTSGTTHLRMSVYDVQ